MSILHITSYACVCIQRFQQNLQYPRAQGVKGAHAHCLKSNEITSCEPRRTKAYSEDLRWRIVWQRESLRKSCKEVATNLGVDPVTVSTIVTRFRETGHVQKKSHTSRRAFPSGIEMAYFAHCAATSGNIPARNSES